MGRSAPNPFYEEPEIFPISVFYWTAYCDLMTERAIGMSVGPIPWSSVLRYAEQHGIDDADEFDRFWHIVHAVDAENMRLINRVKDPQDGKLADVASTNDPEGMKRIMENLRRRKKAG